MILLAQAASSTNPAVYILLGAMMLILFLYFVFWVWMILDCLRNEPPDYRYKFLWLVVMFVFGGLAAFMYNITRRKQRIRMYGR